MPTSQEGETDEAPAEKPAGRAYYPPTDIGSSIAEFIRTLFEDIDSYSYKAADADVEADDRLETMVMSRGMFVVGLIKPHRPDVARRLWANLKRTSYWYNGQKFLDDAMLHIGAAIGEVLWGRGIPGTSLDYGEGMGGILGHGRDVSPGGRE